MKKKLGVVAFLICSLSAFAEMEVERGYGDIEFATNYYNLETRADITSPYKEIHDFISQENDFLYKEGATMSWDKENIFRVYAAGGSAKKYNNIGGGILAYHSYDEGAFVGIKADFRKVNFKFRNNEKLKGNRGSIHLIFDKQDENGTRLFVTPYYIFDTIENVKNKSIGIYLKQNIALDLSRYNLSEQGFSLFAEVDAHRNEVKKEKTMKKNRNKNDSIRAGLGISYEKEIEFDELIIKPKATVAYEREFLEDRKYRSLDVKAKDLDNVRMSLGVNMTYKNVEFDVENSFLKSTNTRNHENRLSATLRYKF